MRILQESPYYDDYNPDKNYVQIAARPGFVAQAREFTQMGTMQRDFLARLGDAVFKDGSIINGIQLSVDENRKSAKISPGRLYLGGLVRIITEEVTVTLAGVGPEIIGVKLVTNVVTEAEDQTLRDPAQNYENYNREGAHRIKETVEWFVNDPDAVPVFNLLDGQLVKAPDVESIDWISEMLARRTYDTSGNYKVSGLELLDRHEVAGGKILVSMTSGKAYIQGFEVVKPSVSVISLDYSVTKREVKGEPKTFRTGTNTYQLNNSPFSEFNRVVATVEHSQRVTRGNSQGGMDYLTKTPVESIVSVTHSSNGTTYTLGEDYQLVSDAIDWSPNGKEPKMGETYDVVYRYTKQMEIGTDVESQVNEDTGATELIFKEGGDKPVNASQVYIDYNFFLARTDLVCIDKDGNIHVLKGVPDVMRLVQPPTNQDESLLVIGAVTISPQSSEITVNNMHTTRLTQNEIYNLLRRLRDMEYNQAISDLDQEAMDEAQATSLKGILTDGFLGFTKCNLGNDQFDCSLDIDNRLMTLPFDQEVKQLDIAETSLGTKLGKFGNRVVTSVYDNKLEISQPKTTSAINVNPYSSYSIMSLVDIEPKVDNWIDEETITVNNTRTQTNTLYRTNTTDEVKNNRKIVLRRSSERTETHYGSTTVTGTETDVQDSGSSTEMTSELVLDEVITYMRQIRISVKGMNFSGSDSVECYFDNKKVPLLPDDGYAVGSTEGSLRVKPDGTVRGSFQVPKLVPSGVVDVELRGTKSEAGTQFRSEGRKRIMKNTILTTYYKTKTVTTNQVRTKIVTRYVDPVAQSFNVTQDSFISQVGLFFKTKDTLKPVVVQIRPMNNGFPEPLICAEAVLTPDDVKISEDGSLETLVKLNQPVYCKAGDQYAICVLTDSDKYQIFRAKLSEREIGSGAFVTSQPYVEGVLFTSSNGATWTVEQDSDLKFNVYRCDFTEDGTVLYDSIDLDKHSRFILATDFLDYNNSGMRYFYRTEESQPWVPMLPYSEKSLVPNKDKKLFVKVELGRKDNLAPLIAIDASNIILIKDKPEGTYITRSVFMSENYTSINIISEMRIPSGSNYEIFYNKTMDPDDWTKITEPPTITPLSHNKGEEYSRYEWTVSDVSSKVYALKLVLTTDNILDRPEVYKIMNILKY